MLRKLCGKKTILTIFFSGNWFFAADYRLNNKIFIFTDFLHCYKKIEKPFLSLFAKCTLNEIQTREKTFSRKQIFLSAKWPQRIYVLWTINIPPINGNWVGSNGSNWFKFSQADLGWVGNLWTLSLSWIKLSFASPTLIIFPTPCSHTRSIALSCLSSSSPRASFTAFLLFLHYLQYTLSPYKNPFPRSPS